MPSVLLEHGTDQLRAVFLYEYGELMASLEDLEYAMAHTFKVPPKRELEARDRTYAMVLLSAAKKRIRSATSRLWNLEPTPGEQKLVGQMILTLTDLKTRRTSDPEAVIKYLNDIYHNAAVESTGVKLSAYNLRELLSKVLAIGGDFIKEPTITTIQRLEARLEDAQTCLNALRNLSALTQDEINALPQVVPQWVLFLPLEDIELRLRHLEECGE